MDAFRKAGRDCALSLLEEHRGGVIDIARIHARSIAEKNGTVTSTEVLASMAAVPGLEGLLEGLDRRFMGPVFSRRDWIPCGWTNTGSHARPDRIWRLRSEGT